MVTVGIPQPSEQASTYARVALEAFKRASGESRSAAPIEPSRLPDAEREKFWALAYDAMLALQAQTAETQPRVAVEEITAGAEWYGWWLSVPHSQIEALIDGTEIASIIATFLGVIPAVGELIAIGLHAYLALYKVLVLSCDRGNGVYLTQLWVNTPSLLFFVTPR